MEQYEGTLVWEQRQRVEALKEARSVIGGQSVISRTVLDRVGDLVYVAGYIISGTPSEEK